MNNNSQFQRERKRARERKGGKEKWGILWKNENTLQIAISKNWCPAWIQWNCWVTPPPPKKEVILRSIIRYHVCKDGEGVYGTVTNTLSCGIFFILVDIKDRLSQYSPLLVCIMYVRTTLDLILSLTVSQFYNNYCILGNSQCNIEDDSLVISSINMHPFFFSLGPRKLLFFMQTRSLFWWQFS